MKHVFASLPVLALLVLTSCTQSPEKLVATANKYHQRKQYQEASILYQRAIAKDKLYGDAYYREALNLLDQRKISDAVAYLRRAVDLQPGNVDALTKLSEIYLAAYQSDPKRFQSVFSDLKDLDNKILLKDPNSFDGLRIRAQMTMAEGRFDESLPMFEQANKVKPYSRELIGWYAQAYTQSQQGDKAVALVNDMLAHDKTWAQGYQFLFIYYGHLGDKERAEKALRDNAQNDPASETALNNYANFLAANNRLPEAETIIRQTLNNRKTFPKARLIVGDFYLRTKQFDKAATEYETGEKENSSDVITYKERLVALETYRNHPTEAAKLAQQLAEEHPKDSSANEIYASVLLQTGQRSDAAKSLDSLKALVAKNPGDPVLHLDLARAYFGVNEKDKALTEALEAAHSELKSTNPRVAVIAPANIVAARIYEDRGQHAKAIELADGVLASQPTNPDAILIRDRALVGTNQPEKAQAELENLVKQFPKFNDAHYQLAELYLGQKSFDKANAEFEILNSAKPPDIRGFLGIQSVKMNTGRGEEAILTMQDLVDKNPTTLPYRYELANFQGALAGLDWNTNRTRSNELLQKAADNYKEILKTTANSSEVWLRLGVMQRQLMQFDQALASFEQAGTADPKNTAAFLNQALVCEAINRKKEAMDAYNKVLALDPDNPLVLNNLAMMTADSGSNLDQAMTYAQRAKKQKPDNANISDTLGYVYFKKDLNGEALRIFKQLSQANPQEPTFHFHLAMALAKSGDKQAARDEANKALQTTHSLDEKKKIESFVSQLG